MIDLETAQRMRAARAHRRISQDQARQEIGIAIATYNKAENSGRMAYSTYRKVERWLLGKRKKRRAPKASRNIRRRARHKPTKKGRR